MGDSLSNPIWNGYIIARIEEREVYVNVKYPPAPLVGAKGGGTIDDSAAFQAAADWVHSRGGGKVIAPKDTYKISQNINGYTNVEFEAEYGTMIWDYNTSGYCFNFVGGARFATDAVKNFKISGMQFKNKATSGGAIKLKNVFVGVIDDIFIENGDYGSNVIFIEDFFNVKVRAYMNSNEGATGVYVNAATGNSGQLILDNCLLQRNAINLHIEGTGNIVDGVTVLGGGNSAATTYGLKIGSNVFNVSFPQCHFENHDGLNGVSDTCVYMVLPSGVSEGIDFSKAYFINNKYSIVSDRCKRVVIFGAEFDANNIADSVGITQGVNDQRWFIGPNLFQNIGTNVIAHGQYHVDFTNFAINNSGVITLGKTSVEVHFGSGSPEGVVTAPVNSVYFRTNGAPGTHMYFKNTGTGATGWLAFGYQNIVFASASRPNANTLPAGSQVWDSTLKKPIWSDGTNWYDSTGTLV